MKTLTGFRIDQIEEMGFIFTNEAPMEFGQYLQVYEIKEIDFTYNIVCDEFDAPFYDYFEINNQMTSNVMRKNEWIQIIKLLKKAFEL